jgi:pyruvate-ferredoxin/flavodoxin oxidoreductase
MAGLGLVLDGNEAVAHVAYRASEVIAIYPITPSSPMGEWADQWAAERRPNHWGTVPRVAELQSEGGAAGAVHGALQAGALTTTFTASQGLMLMLPNMYRIAGELTPTVFHVAARSLAAQGLSIFGDQSDVMAARATGFAMLASGSVQETADLALVAHAAALAARVPFLHFFDGFRTSHEVMRIDLPGPDVFEELIDNDLVRQHRARALSPDHPFIRGAAYNPDTAFQARETVNPFYLACPAVVQDMMDRVARLTGRSYHLFDYHGAPDAERVLVLMGSGAEAAQETVEALCRQGQKVGVVKVRLYRPFAVEQFLAVLPPSVRTLVVLDRTKEPGGLGEPLYLDVLAAFNEGQHAIQPRVIGGRYGLSSKEFTPAMIRAVLDNADRPVPRNHFTIGINDDVTHTSLDYDRSFSLDDPETVQAVFYGLGSDGTVGANKNSIKIIGEATDLHVQGYFVYDSKKSGSVTISHLRFGPRPIRSTYLINQAQFVACHQFAFLEQRDLLALAQTGATFLLNSPYGPEAVWDQLPRPVQEQILEKKLRLFVIDASGVARELGMAGRINTIMQTCFFALSGVLPRDKAIAAIKKSVAKTYGKRGQAVVDKNHAAIDRTLERLFEVVIPDRVTARRDRRLPVPLAAPSFVREVTARMILGEGDDLPVSAFPPDCSWPSGTTRWEKRNIAQDIPVWEEGLCIQCGKCVMVCPHAVIRAKVYEPAVLDGAPEGFKSAPARWPDRSGMRYTLQVAAEDCTGCRLCVEACPAKDRSAVKRKAINMAPQEPLRAQEVRNWDFFLNIPDPDRATLRHDSVKDIQLLEPLFEFSGACAGCGETPYLKLLSQLFGDRALIANATGCSSIYGGNLPTTPWAVNREGRGPAWSNSLFEDNAEFGLGMRLAVDQQSAHALALLGRLEPMLGSDLVRDLREADQSTEDGIRAQRERVHLLRQRLDGLDGPEVKDLRALADTLVKKSVWIVGGDGWAYDIGYGGLDHVLASGQNVNVLVLDTEVYSNTGGQMSKSTPRGAVAKFAAAGKRSPKKDLGLMALTYGTCYVARVAFGASDTQTVTAFREAEAFTGPSLIIAYSPCIAHGYDLAFGLEQQKMAVQSGYWPLYRYDPDLLAQGKNPLHLDSRAPSLPLQKYIYNETRYTMLVRSEPEIARQLLAEAQEDVERRWQLYEYLAAQPANGKAKEDRS